MPLQAPSLASLKSHFHPQIVSLTFKVPSLFGGADVLIYRHKVRRGRGADAGERSPDEPTAHPRDRPPSGVFIDVFSFLFLFSGGRVSSLPPIFLLDITIEPRYNMNRTSIHRGERCETRMDSKIRRIYVPMTETGFTSFSACSSPSTATALVSGSGK